MPPRKRKKEAKEQDPDGQQVQKRAKKEEPKKDSPTIESKPDFTSKRQLFVDEEPSRNYWLIKSEPNTRMVKGVDIKYSIQDLMAEENQTTCWDGVRNMEARNNMRAMNVGDLALFYHSNCKELGIYGIVEVVKSAYPDHTQFDIKDPHYDPRSKKDEPRWDMVDVKFVRTFKEFIPQAELKKHYNEHTKNDGILSNMALFTRLRLSVQPVTKPQFDFIMQLEMKSHS